MTGITALMTIHRRPHTLARQLAAIRAQTVPPAAVWAFAQEPSEEMVARLSGLGFDRIVTCDPNSYFHLRFAVALTAPTEFVCVFDDDTIPGSCWFQSCVATMADHPGILGTRGLRIDPSDLGQYHAFGWERPSPATHEVDILGHAWFLRPSWITHLFAEPPVTGANGEDIELCARAFRLGGVRSYVPPHPEGDDSQWGSLEARSLGGDANASFRRPGHRAERHSIINAELAKGWRPWAVRTVDERA